MAERKRQFITDLKHNMHGSIVFKCLNLDVKNLRQIKSLDLKLTSEELDKFILFYERITDDKKLDEESSNLKPKTLVTASNPMSLKKLLLTQLVPFSSEFIEKERDFKERDEVISVLIKDINEKFDQVNKTRNEDKISYYKDFQQKLSKIAKCSKNCSKNLSKNLWVN